MTQCELGKNHFHRYVTRRKVEKIYHSSRSLDQSTSIHNVVMKGKDGGALYDGEWIEWKGGRDTALAYRPFMLYHNIKARDERRRIFRTFKRFRRIAGTSEPIVDVPAGTTQ